jgi:Gas vesicle synthesis protein GvpL/GvpF
MAWYVFALVDKAPAGRAGKGLTGPLSLREIAGAYLVVERRADVPPIAFGSLKKHQDVVARLAKAVPAILPVRFGTLLETGHLDEALQDRDAEIAEAFDLVRGRVQFTWRAAAPRVKAAGGAGKAEDVQKALTGTAYLRQAARAANPALPIVFQKLHTRLAPVTAGLRYQPGTAALPDAMYHLVARTDADRYLAAAAPLKAASPRLSLSGPFPPFAFAPELL